MSDESDDDRPPAFLRPDLDERFELVFRVLGSTKVAMDDSESDADIQRFQQYLDDLMKIFHDSRHVSRGVVKLGASMDDRRWLIGHYDSAISALDRWGLADKDESIDLISERRMLLNSTPIDDPVNELPRTVNNDTDMIEVFQQEDANLASELIEPEEPSRTTQSGLVDVDPKRVSCLYLK
jgi:hypothetical protein